MNPAVRQEVSTLEEVPDVMRYFDPDPFKGSVTEACRHSDPYPATKTHYQVRGPAGCAYGSKGRYAGGPTASSDKPRMHPVRKP